MRSIPFYAKAKFKNERPKIKDLDIIWADCVKLRAKNRSEYSPYKETKSQFLHAHHIFGKATYSLRFDLDNGVCLTSGEHFYIAHGNQTRAEKFKQWALKLRGSEEKLKLKLHQVGGVDLFAMQEYLKIKRKEYQNG